MVLLLVLLLVVVVVVAAVTMTTAMMAMIKMMTMQSADAAKGQHRHNGIATPAQRRGAGRNFSYFISFTAR